MFAVLRPVLGLGHELVVAALARRPVPLSEPAFGNCSFG